MKMNIKIKVNDLKLSVLFIASLFILGQAFLTLAVDKNNSNLFLDSDQDGLSDQEEKTYGTDPNNADTDRDGYTDGAEVKSGYNPLKPSPEDKIGTVSNEKTTAITSNFGEKTNLTQELSKKLSMEMATASGVGGDVEASSEEITTENLRSLVQEFLTETSTTDTFTTISVDDIEVKEQDYSSLSSDEAEKKRKEDFTDYSISIFYTLSLNSEKPILSSTGFERTLSDVLSETATALLDGDLNYFNNLGLKGQKVMTEMREIEVPEEFQFTHVKMMNMFGYGLSLVSLVQRNESDPVANLINFSKINSFLDVFEDALTEFKNKSNQYELDNDYIKDELEKLGIDTSDSE